MNKSVMQHRIVITGLGMVTPLGMEPEEVYAKVEQNHRAAVPVPFDSAPFGCPVHAVVGELDPLPYVDEPKMVRLMNRDAQLAVVAARRALEDAGLRRGQVYAPEEAGLFGATGMAGLPPGEVVPLLKHSLSSEGTFDLERFGKTGLRAVSPILSFKILANMPVCFVGINEGIRGVNAIFTPWEGNGAQAIECGVRALQEGDARCVLVGGCDARAHELAFLSLSQQGLFDSWRQSGQGLVPAEGAVFLVMETEESARARGACIYARLKSFLPGTQSAGSNLACVWDLILNGLFSGNVVAPQVVVSSCNGDPVVHQDESEALKSRGICSSRTLFPKQCMGDLFAAAAPAQLAIGAMAVRTTGGQALINCFGHGSEKAAFLLEGQ